MYTPEPINIMRAMVYTLFAHVADGRGEQWHIIITIENDSDPTLNM